MPNVSDKSTSGVAQVIMPKFALSDAILSAQVDTCSLQENLSKVVASLFANVSLGQTISVQWQESWRVSDQAFSFWPIPARTQKPPAIYTLSNLLHLIRRVSRIIKCIVTSGCMTMNGHKSKISPLSPLRGAGFAFHSCLRGCYDKKEWDPFFDDEITKQVSSSWETPLKITKYWCMAWQERGNSANPKGD